MLTLTINNSYSRLAGLSSLQMKSLKPILSYEANPNAAFFSGSPRSTRRYLIDKYGNFPSGLLPLVREWAKDLDDYSERDLRRLPASTVEFNPQWPSPLYPEQLDAVIACTDAHRGTVSAVTAFGKSMTMAGLITYLGVKTLIVVPNLTLKRQLSDTLTKLFGNLNNITIENIDSPTLNTPGDYDCLIIDEAHHVASKTYRNLNKKVWNGVYHRFFFTATAFRNRDEEQLLFESVAGQVVYRIDYKQAVAKHYVTPVTAYYVDLPNTSTEAFTYAEVYSSLVVHNSKRNEIIAGILESLHRQNISTLCLTKEIAHGENINKKLSEQFKLHVPFIQGANEDNANILASFNDRLTPVVMGTTAVLGEGTDSRPAEYGVIAGLGKSKPQFMQQIGRLLRRYPGKDTAKVILFRDRSHKYLVKHYNAQKKILLDEYGVVPIKLEI